MSRLRTQSHYPRMSPGASVPGSHVAPHLVDYAGGVPAAGDPVAAGITGGGGGGVIGAQSLAGGGPAGIWIAT